MNLMIEIKEHASGGIAIAFISSAFRLFFSLRQRQQKLEIQINWHVSFEVRLHGIRVDDDSRRNDYEKK